MDTTENKTEQYTKREFPKFKPQANGEYLCGNKNFSFNAVWDNDCWAVRNPVAIAWFFEPSPMEVKDEEAIMSLLKKAFDTFRYVNFPHNHPSWEEWVSKNNGLIKKTIQQGLSQSPKPVEGDVSQYDEDLLYDCGEIFD